MSIYRIFDKNINSEINLKNIPLSTFDGADDYSLKIVNKSPIDKGFKVYHQIKYEDNPWVSFLKNGNRLALSFHEFADFTVERNKKNIYCFVKPVTSPGTFAHLFADHVVPNILTLTQNMVFHASTVKIGDHAVSFLAPSGTGKSTLAAYFGLRNHELISDDSILVTKNNNSYWAVPSYPGIRLWPSSVEMLFDESPQQWEVSQYNEKKVINFDYGLIKTRCEPTLLKAIYILNTDEETNLEQISQSDAFSFLVKNLYRFDFEDRKNNAHEFRFLSEMISNMELYKLNYSHSKDSLDKAYKLVTENSLN